jgi:phosphatidylinositol kinase/protein kinase (PI-3  family)
VPFRLTPNLVDALGATGVDGVYRKGCEITMEVLRENKDSLISVLEAFIHDPLVEWQEAKRREVCAFSAPSTGESNLTNLFAGTKEQDQRLGRKSICGEGHGTHPIEIGRTNGR